MGRQESMKAQLIEWWISLLIAVVAVGVSWLLWWPAWVWDELLGDDDE
jgi:hypothetical protein